LAEVRNNPARPVEPRPPARQPGQHHTPALRSGTVQRLSRRPEPAIRPRESSGLGAALLPWPPIPDRQRPVTGSRTRQTRRQLGARTAARLRPPPAARGPAPESSSSTPSDRVASRTPAARGPGPPAGSRHAPAHGPRPPSAAAAAAHPDAGRSSRTSPTRISLVTIMLPIPHQHAAFQEATGYFPATLCGIGPGGLIHA
jgi:hypothetical protein